MIKLSRLPFMVVAALALCVGIAGHGSFALAQEAPHEDAPYVEHAEHYVAQLKELDTEMDALKATVADASGDVARILNRRIEQKEVEALRAIDGFAALTLKEQEAGGDVSKYKPVVVDLLERLPPAVMELIDEIRTAAREEAEAAADAKGKDLLPLVESRKRTAERLHALYRGLIKNRELAQAYGLDTSASDAELARSLESRAAALSIALELSQEDAAILTTQSTDFPDDQDIKAELKVAERSVDVLTDSLATTVTMMETLELDTGDYRQQLIVVRGAVSTDLFDPDVILGLAGRWLETFVEWAGERMPQIAINIMIFFVIMFIFWLLARLAKKLVTKGIDASRLNVSRLLREITIATVKNLVLLIGFLIALGQMGISIGPALAGLGVAGFVIGFALQDTLGNFASGMMILLYRPFDVGDVVEIGGVFGKVKAMSLVNTTMLTLDNQTLILPNTKIWGDVIKNVTSQTKRRVDMVFGISYTDDIPKAEKILTSILEDHDKVLDDPESMVRLHELADSSVNFVVRPWSKTDDYWDVYWDVTREVKMRFDREGVSIPFPQRDVHVFHDNGDPGVVMVSDGQLVQQGHVDPKGALPGEDGGDGDDAA